MTRPLLRHRLLRWTGITLAVMLILPFVVVRVVPQSAGMAMCMMLFYAINPIYSIMLGIVAGQDVRALWTLPLISAAAFLAGAWLFLDIHEPWFIAYAAVYLGIGVIAMMIATCLKLKSSCLPSPSGAEETSRLSSSNKPF